MSYNGKMHDREWQSIAQILVSYIQTAVVQEGKVISLTA